MYMGSTNYRFRPQLKEAPPVQDSISFSLEMSGAMSASRVLYASPTGPALADKDVLSAQDKILGLTISSTSVAGEFVSVLGEGYHTDPSYTFTPGPVYLGNSGLLTQTPPTTGLLVQLGVAISATELYFDVGLAVKLA